MNVLRLEPMLVIPDIPKRTASAAHAFRDRQSGQLSVFSANEDCKRWMGMSRRMWICRLSSPDLGIPKPENRLSNKRWCTAHVFFHRVYFSELLLVTLGHIIIVFICFVLRGLYADLWLVASLRL